MRSARSFCILERVINEAIFSNSLESKVSLRIPVARPLKLFTWRQRTLLETGNGQPLSNCAGRSRPRHGSLLLRCNLHRKIAGPAAAAVSGSSLHIQDGSKGFRRATVLMKRAVISCVAPGNTRSRSRSTSRMISESEASIRRRASGPAMKHVMMPPSPSCPLVLSRISAKTVVEQFRYPPLILSAQKFLPAHEVHDDVGTEWHLRQGFSLSGIEIADRSQNDARRHGQHRRLRGKCSWARLSLIFHFHATFVCPILRTSRWNSAECIPPISPQARGERRPRRP